ncbi:MAG: hypothetical protein ACFFCW_32635 [Candidatus Hodarchaeota archaeon]
MNNQLKITEPSIVDVLIEEYKFVSSSRENYMLAFTQTNFYFGLIIATFGFGVWKFDWLLLLVPFMIIIQYSIVQWNQYHSFLAEVFLPQLESKLNSLVRDNSEVDPKLSFFTFYNVLFHQSMFIRDRKTRVPLIKPTALLSATLSIVNLSIFIYCLCKGCYLLAQTAFGIYLEIPYVGSCLILFILLVYNFLRQPKSTKPILRNIYLEYVDSCEKRRKGSQG